ncbi:MAG: hypothetical protein AMXMBFR64_57450 [Myxococcales bacterium]
MTRIAIIACSRTKLLHAAPARDLYQGQLFRASVAYAEATCDRWYVLSALHHVVDPDEVLEPYERSMADVIRSGRGRTVSPDPRTAWATRCRGQLMGHRYVLGARVIRGDVVVMLAGRPYAEPLTEWLEAWGAAVDMADGLVS